jgi:hypothetical protein
MSSSGVSLLAAKLKSHSRQPSESMSASSSTALWASHESVKLTDSVAGNVPNISLGDLRSQIHTLMEQTGAQEKALLRFNHRMLQQQQVIERLRGRILDERVKRSLYKCFIQWRSSVNHDSATPKPEQMHTPRVTESINLNDTLRHLAMSLQSPTHENSVNISHMGTLGVPLFPTARMTIKSHQFLGS